jgi:hypothetical protein
MRLPEAEFLETQKELEAKGEPAVPLFWLSWRQFAPVVRQANENSVVPPILAHVLELLEQKWVLAEIKMGEWPKVPTIPIECWHLPLSWRWPRAPTYLPAWEFDTRS